MPYIKLERRAAVDTIIEGLVGRLRSINATKGDLNYTVTQVVLGALRPDTGWTYSSLSDAVGALSDAANEIERRILGPYEDAVISLNGDLSALRQAEDDVNAKYDAVYEAQDRIFGKENTFTPITKVAAELYQETIDEAFDRR